MSTDATLHHSHRVRSAESFAQKRGAERARTDAALRQHGDALDVRELPSYVFSHRSLMWWGTVGMMAIEGTVFALAIMAYFYLRATRAQSWPPGLHPPEMLWGTLNIVILLVSAIPNHLAKRGAERLDLPAARLWTWVALAFGIAFIAVRAL